MPDSNNVETNQDSLEHLREENRRLRGLVNSFSQINVSIDLDTVLMNTLHTATDLMNAEIGSIALMNNARTELVFVESTDPNFDRLKNFSVPLGKGIAGHVAKTGEIVRVEDVSRDDRFYSRIDREMQQKTETYICAPLIVEDRIIGTAQLMNRRDGQSFTENDEELLAGFARQAALAIQNAQLHKMKMQQRAFESEMELCAEIQKQLFPRSAPNTHEYEIFGFSAPAREVGGDYYGYTTRDDGSYDLVLADISGKGVSASLMVSEFHTGFHLLSSMDYDLLQCMNTLNVHLVDSLVVGRFISAFALRIDPRMDDIHYVLAGHNPPYVLRANGDWIELQRTGLFLGLEKLPYTMQSFRLEKGDLLLAFSDGYPEVKNAEEDLFEEERLRSLVIDNMDRPLEQIHQKIETAIDEFRGDTSLPDDRTLLLVRRL
ncbi:MAG: SpoIIE family protein phosphatase [Leptospiraceae bacterium]|nr:SpoIIE family protein phosphatase [Leptospiraceae bacterium]